MILETKPGRFRYKAIFAATRRGLERFENLDDMPPVLRARCLKALESRDSGTVVITGETADTAGTEKAERAPPVAAAATAGLADGRVWGRLRQRGLELLSVAAAGSLFWLAWRG